MRQAIWGLPQAGIIANRRLRQKLALFGYFELVNMPGLWYHESHLISFTLMVDDFGVKYEYKGDVDHLVASIKTTYTLTKNWAGDLYCGIALAWDYVNRTVDISMPGYIKKKLQECRHVQSKHTQMCLYLLAPKQFGTEAQAPLPTDNSPRLDKKDIRNVQCILRSIMYYAHAVDMTVLMALSTIASVQTAAMEQTFKRCTQLLDYLASNSNITVQYYASNMVMNIHLDASYLSKAKA